jgi:hypothetical protein
MHNTRKPSKPSTVASSTKVTAVAPIADQITVAVVRNFRMFFSISKRIKDAKNLVDQWLQGVKHVLAPSEEQDNIFGGPAKYL